MTLPCSHSNQEGVGNLGSKDYKDTGSDNDGSKESDGVDGADGVGMGVGRREDMGDMEGNEDWDDMVVGVGTSKMFEDRFQREN